MIYAILAILIILAISGGSKTNTFTVTCDKRGSHDVNVTANGLRCRNCGAEYKN